MQLAPLSGKMLRSRVPRLSPKSQTRRLSAYNSNFQAHAQIVKCCVARAQMLEHASSISHLEL
eukprot:4679869-Amphidinium_carterae.2